MSGSFLRWEILDALQGAGMEIAEVYLKRGRNRRFTLRGGARSTHFVEEEGWAVRAGDRRCSFFLAGSGRPRVEGPWPDPDGYPLRLPEDRSGEEEKPWREPMGLDAPLAGEKEGWSIVDAVAEELSGELPGARLSGAVLEDGSSESEIASSRGVEADWRFRLATLRLEAVEGTAGTEVAVTVVAREARELRPKGVARALADRFAALGKGRTPERDRAEMVLSPTVGARLLGLVAPWLLIGTEAEEVADSLVDRRGRLGSEAVTLVDDGRLPEGLLAAPVDGEGVPSREVVLVERGVFRQPLLAWWQSAGRRVRWSGCSRRPSWRDLPTPGPTHLFLRPGDVPPSSLVAGVARGYYLLEGSGRGILDRRSARFALPVCGFAIGSGEASHPIGEAWLCGLVGSFLHGVQTAGRDLRFHPNGGLVGCPSLLVTGLELRGRP